jgi:hypothetical protein
LSESQRLCRSDGISRVRSLRHARRFFQTLIAAELGTVSRAGGAHTLVSICAATPPRFAECSVGAFSRASSGRSALGHVVGLLDEVVEDSEGVLDSVVVRHRGAGVERAPPPT